MFVKLSEVFRYLIIYYLCITYTSKYQYREIENFKMVKNRAIFKFFRSSIRLIDKISFQSFSINIKCESELGSAITF